MDQNQITDSVSESGESITPSAADQLAERLKASGIDPAKLEELKRKLNAIRKSDEQTASGSEAPEDVVPTGPVSPDKDPRVGANVDWSEYNIDFNLLHLYRKATCRPTPEGMKWVVMVFDFFSVSREWNKHGQTVNPISGNGAKEPLNLAEYLKDMCNGRDQWRIATLQPGPNGQCGVLLEREVPVVLPDPEPLKKKEEVDAPTDPELKAVEDAGLAFMEQQNPVDNEPEVRDDGRGEAVVGLRAIERGSDEDLQIRETLEDGVLPAAARVRVAAALERNAGLTTPAPQGKGLQPEAVHNPLIEDVVPASGYSAAQDLLRALNDPEYRKSLPTE